MKKYSLQIICFLCLLFQLSCEHVVFLPVQGEIEGYVRDTNGKPVAGITVSAAFEAASSSGQAAASVQSAKTDLEGYYRLNDLWDEISLSINHPGFEPVFHFIDLKDEARPVVNIELIGSPKIQGIALDKNALSLSLPTPDTIVAQIEVLDAYNSQDGSYKGSLILQDATGNTQAIVGATNPSGSQSLYLLEALISSDELAKGTYSVTVEATDPDGNTHRITTDQIIQIE